MSSTPVSATNSSVREQARAGRTASRKLALLSNEARNSILLAAAKRTELSAARILAANAEDCRAAVELVRSGKLSQAAFARLRVAEKTIREMVLRLEEVARLADPIGKQLATTELDDGLVLYKESCPLGVVGIVFESRPDVVPQVTSLALKSGNAVILKGGAEAAHSNEVLVSIWREALGEFPSIPVDSVSLLQSRQDVLELLAQDRNVDLIVPRGSYDLVNFIMEHSRIPVLGHGEGICHVYVDRAADREKAVAIVFDAKCQYPAVCNAAETLLIHHAVAAELLPPIVAKLKSAGVEVRGCEQTVALLPHQGIIPATEKDW